MIRARRRRAPSWLCSAQHGLDGGEDVVLIALGHVGEEGEGKNAVGVPFGVGEQAGRLGPGFAIILLGVGGPEVQAGADVVRLERLHEGVAGQARAVDVQPDDEQVPGTRNAG